MAGRHRFFQKIIWSNERFNDVVNKLAAVDVTAAMFNARQTREVFGRWSSATTACCTRCKRVIRLGFGEYEEVEMHAWIRPAVVLLARVAAGWAGERLRLFARHDR